MNVSASVSASTAETSTCLCHVCDLSSWPTGKAHIRRAIHGHEEALRIYGLCPSLSKLELLQGILKASHQRSLNKYSENQNEDEFTDYTEAPDIVRKSCYSLNQAGKVSKLSRMR